MSGEASGAGGRLGLCNGVDAVVLQVGWYGGQERPYHNALWRGREEGEEGEEGKSSVVNPKVAATTATSVA